MRIRIVFLLLAATASALPRRDSQGNGKAPDAKAPDKKKGLDVCKIDFASNLLFSPMQWMATGAPEYLAGLLNDGTKGWSSRLLKQAEVGGGSGETSYDCTNLLRDSCGPTQDCKDYKPPAAFLVHASMANLFSIYSSIHEKLQNLGIWQLSTGIKDIEEKFGSSDSPSALFSVMPGVFGLAGTIAPNPAVAGPLAAMSSGLGLASTIYQAEKNEPDLNDSLEKNFGKLFKAFSTALEKGVKDFFSGNFPDNVDGKVKISATFITGSLMDNASVNNAVDTWTKTVTETINAFLIIQALKINDYLIQRVTGIDKDECEDGNGIYFDERCNRIGTKLFGEYEEAPQLKAMSGDMLKSFTKDYGIDYKKAMQNAIDCDGKDPEISKMGEFVMSHDLPKCLVSLPILEANSGDCSGGTGLPCMEYN